jgi:hypothetical protein
MAALMELDGLPAAALNRPELSKGLESGDIEAVVQWALSRTGRLPWSNPHDSELSLDRGLTAQPRRKPRGHWYLVEACAGLNFGAARVVMMKNPGADAAMVIEAIKALPPEQSSLVLSFARSKSRPNALVGVEPRQITKIVSWRKAAKLRRKKHKGRHKPVTITVWEPCDPGAICAARAAYAAWHAGMMALVTTLKGELKRWPHLEFSVSATPWEPIP